MKKILIGIPVLIALLLIVLTSSGTAQTVNRSEKPPSSPGTPDCIYITDFRIDLSDSGGQEGRLLPRRRMQEDPAYKASKLVELLASSVTSELQKESIPVRRLYTDQAIPATGWLVKGQFVEADEGNRLRRAVIGFGAGATDMQVEVEVIDLANRNDQPFAVFGTDSRSGRGPGAVVMKMNPYAAAAKFVLSKRSSEKDVRKTARQIAGVLVKYVEESKERSE